MAEPGNSGAITCQALARQATEYIESRLAADVCNAIEQHLQSCSACRTYVEQLKLVRDSLRKLPDPPPDSTRNALTERFVREMRGRKNPF